MLKWISLALALVLAGPAHADCPAGTQLYARAWVIDFKPPYQSTEFAHAQLWNKGTSPITLRSFNAIPRGTTAVMALVAGPSGKGIPNQDPLDGTKQRLVKTIVDFGADLAPGLNGGSGGFVDTIGQASNGEMRAQISETAWLLGQTWHFYVNQQTPPISALSGLKIPPGHGLTLRAGNPGVAFAFSFSWCEP